jgi:hypothetical protein
MLMQWVPGGALVTAMIGFVGYLTKRHIERREEFEEMALLNLTADLCTKLRQSGVTLSDLHAIQDELLRHEAQTQSSKSCALLHSTPDNHP